MALLLFVEFLLFVELLLLLFVVLNSSTGAASNTNPLSQNS